MPDWEKIRDEYISSPEATYRSLGEKYGINANVVAVHGKKENWVALRGQIRGETMERAMESVANNQMPRAKRVIMAIDLILDHAIVMLQTRGNDDLTPRELQQLADVVRSAREIYGIKSSGDTEEQRARIAKLRREAEDDDARRSITIQLGGGADEYAN